MTEAIRQAIQFLTENGYKVTPPPREVKDEYTFDRAWNLYEKKVGCKSKLEKKWNSMSRKDRKAAIEYIPLYVLSQPDKKYRKNFQTFLNQRGWEDELIGATEPPTTTNVHPSEISQTGVIYWQNKGQRSSSTHYRHVGASTKESRQLMQNAVGDIS